MKKNLLAILLGVILSVSLVGAAEVFFRINESTLWFKKNAVKKVLPGRDKKKNAALKAEISSAPVFQWQPRYSEQEHKILEEEGLDRAESGPLSCCILDQFFGEGRFVSKVKSRLSGKVVYEVRFTFDQNKRRITPDPVRPEKDILIFGDSFVLGEGVNDEETFSYFLGQMRPKTKVYNLGLSGGALHESLTELTEGSIRLEGVGQRKMTALYIFIDEHMERIVCRSQCLIKKNRRLQMKPFYFERDGELVFGGTFLENRKVRNFFYNLANQSALLRFFNVVIPPRFTQRDFHLVASMAKEAQTKLVKFYKNVDFYFVFYPFSSREFSGPLIQALKEQNVKYLDYSDINSYTITEGRHIVPGDGHPSPISHYVTAYLLNRDLPR